MAARRVSPPGHQRAALLALADRRHQDPAAVLDEALDVLAALDDDSPDRGTASWVVGLAHHELGDAAAAVASFTSAVERSRAARDAHTEAVARASMAISLLSLGQAQAAEREIATASRSAPPTARGLVRMLEALVLQRTGHLDAALSAYAGALSRLRRDGDEHNVARLLLNRGTLLAYQGRFAEALSDLADSEQLARHLDLRVLTAMAAHNLGFAAGRRGDVPAALAAFDRARTAYAQLGDPPRLVAALAADRCEVFLDAGLSRDAVDAARQALELMGTGGDATHRSEARLLLARALLAHGDLAEAAVEAGAAATTFRRARRGSWATQADYFALRAEIESLQEVAARPRAAVLHRAQRIARDLDGTGWPVEAMHARTFVARVAIARGEHHVARAELSNLSAARSRRSAALQVQTWHATALLRQAEGDTAGARRALRRGLRVVDEHRAALGATELRAAATVHGTELARMGLRLALADGQPWEVLRWAERWRAGALRLPPVSPPADPALDAALQELRERRGEGPSARVRDLERQIRERTLRASDATDRDADALDVAGLRAALDGRTLVELVALERRLHAVCIRDGRARLVDVGAVGPVLDEQRYLRMSHRRLLRERPGSPEAARAADAMTAAATRLDRMLLAPLRLDAGPTVVVPTGALHGLSWSALPTLASSPVTVAPSAALWHRRGAPVEPPDPRRIALVVGPGLPGGAAEVDRLRRRYQGATVLRGRAATVAAVLGAMDRADLVHLAAHGSFRADSPLFSALTLEDGPLTVFDLERVRRAPTTVLLPACDAAVADVQVGDELLGTAAAMIGLGVRSVLAPLLPVPDEATSILMLAVHDALGAGLGPSEALAAAAAASGDDPYARSVAASFVVVGAAEGGATR